MSILVSLVKSFRAWYALHLYIVYELKFEQEPVSENQQIIDPFTEFREILDDSQKILVSQAAKNDKSRAYSPCRA